MRGLCPLRGEALRIRISETVGADIEEVASELLLAVPDVAVCVFSFNQGVYLRQAIESILVQDFAGTVEIIIADDCSTDGSREWLRNLQAEQPGKVRLLLARRNLWCELFPGSVVAFPAYERASRSRYVALLEGDDYWTDPGKLRRQIGHLDSHPAAAGCFTDCLLVDGEGSELEPRPFWNEPYHNNYDRRAALIELRSAYATAALVFRGGVFGGGIPDYFLRAGSDYLLDVAITGFGTLDYIPGVTSAYRIHAHGIWQGGSNFDQLVQVLVRLHALIEDPSFPYEHRADITDVKRWCYHAIVSLKENSGLAELSALLPVSRLRASFDIVHGHWEELRDWRDKLVAETSFLREVELLVIGGDCVDRAFRGREGRVVVEEFESISFSARDQKEETERDFQFFKDSSIRTISALCETTSELQRANKRITYLEDLLQSGWWKLGERLRRWGILSRGYREGDQK